MKQYLLRRTPHRRRVGLLPKLCLLLLAAGIGSSGCGLDLPRDQSGWTQRIASNGVLTVGVPARRTADAEDAGLGRQEREIVETLAHRLHARVEWREGNVHELLEELEERRIPVVAASLPTDSPFAAAVGMTLPYRKDGPKHKDYALAVAPGENHLLMMADRIIADEKRENTIHP